MASFKKWFVNSSIVLTIIYVFGVYLDISKEIFVSNFFYSPILQFFLIFTLLVSLFLIDANNKKDKKVKNSSNEGLLYINHKNFSVDVNLLRDNLEEILENEPSISISNTDIYKEDGYYFFNFLIFLKKDTVVALESLTAKLNAQISFLLQERFGEDFPGNIHIRYANEKEPFPTLDTETPKTNDEPIVIPENIGRPLHHIPEESLEVEEKSEAKNPAPDVNVESEEPINEPQSEEKIEEPKEKPAPKKTKK